MLRFRFPVLRFLAVCRRNFATPSGKAELYNEALKAQGLDPVADFVRPRIAAQHTGEGFPLELLARKADNFLNSTFCNLPAFRRWKKPDFSR